MPPKMESPRAVVLNEFAGRWNYANPPEMFVNASGVAAWALALKGDYWGGNPPPPSELGSYDLVVANLFPTHIASYARLAASRPKGVKWVSLIEGSGELYYDAVPGLKEALDHSDLVISINRHTTPLIQALTTTPVHYLGIPYPVEAMRAKRVPIAERRREVLLCPRSLRTPSIEVVKRCGLTVRAYAPKVSRKVSNVPKYIREGRYSKDIEIRKLEALLPEGSIVGYEKYDAPYFADTAGCLLWVNLDPRYTWGRFVLDAAALGIPIVSTESTGHGSVLFPKTTVKDAFQVGESVEIARRLIQDEQFYRETAEFADAHIEPFSYVAMARALVALL